MTNTNPYYYYEGSALVFTAEYLLSRGSCCGYGCRHCPYEPDESGGITVKPEYQSLQQKLLEMRGFEPLS